MGDTSELPDKGKLAYGYYDPSLIFKTGTGNIAYKKPYTGDDGEDKDPGLTPDESNPDRPEQEPIYDPDKPFEEVGSLSDWRFRFFLVIYNANCNWQPYDNPIQTWSDDKYIYERSGHVDIWDDYGYVSSESRGWDEKYSIKSVYNYAVKNTQKKGSQDNFNTYDYPSDRCFGYAYHHTDILIKVDSTLGPVIKFTGYGKHMDTGEYIDFDSEYMPLETFSSWNYGCVKAFMTGLQMQRRNSNGDWEDV